MRDFEDFFKPTFSPFRDFPFASEPNRQNFGHVDGSESRPGAKDKWKKIIETDLEDGDYYRKAFIKLKKYGVL